MTSEVGICNQALVKVGAARITALTDDTKQARALNAIYTVKRDVELSANPWSFAIMRAQIPASSTAPAFGWAYAYPLPTDFLAMVEVGQDYTFYDTDTGALFGIETDSNGSRAVVTDQVSPLDIRYVYRVTNSGLFPALFVEALACRLAAEVSEELTQSASKKEALWGEYKRSVREARRMNAIEQPPRKNPMGSWERALVVDGY
jgi:hypothetical protein